MAAGGRSGDGARALRRRGRTLIATREGSEPPGGFVRALTLVRSVVLGPTIRSDREGSERLTKAKALAVFSSDALSSSAYATEEMLRVLVLGGAAALAFTVPLSVTLVGVLAIVVISYRQTIAAYPTGGGSYLVAADNLGRRIGLIAAGALLTDYVLTVAVSVAAGVLALTSVIPDLHPHRVIAGVLAIVLIALGNLRGIRESGTIFAIPTYAFVLSLGALIIVGTFQIAAGTLAPYHPPPDAGVASAQGVGVLLLLRAFASGAVALTGVEAISNGIPAFKRPEPRNAGMTIVLMGILLGCLFLGVTTLATHVGVIPDPTEQRSVIAQLGMLVFGPGPALWIVQVTTALILVLAANTSFADFPRLASILARDRFLPHHFATRDPRLAFSSGIVVLTSAAILIYVHFSGSLGALIPLYAVGVFTAFTLSEVGMCVRWWRKRGRNWQRSLAINAVGASVTGLTLLTVAIGKFSEGAWVVFMLVPVIVFALSAIRGHYDHVEAELVVAKGERAVRRKPLIVVPVARADRIALCAIAVARSLGSEVVAVHVRAAPNDDDHDEARVRRELHALAGSEQLTVEMIDSPYRAIVDPLLSYIERRRREDPRRPVIVVLGHFVPRRWWHKLLHDQNTLRLRLRLMSQPNVFVVDAPVREESLASEEADGGERAQDDS